MDLYTPGVALAAARIAELHRQTDQQRLASRLPDRTRVGTGSGHQYRGAARTGTARPPTARAAAAAEQPRR